MKITGFHGNRFSGFAVSTSFKEDFRMTGDKRVGRGVAGSCKIV
jgi:hypothetical protein